MKSRFERFAQMAQEEFGLTVSQTNEGEKMTFESLFGVLPEDIAQYELPYNSVSEQIGYYDNSAIVVEPAIAESQSNRFDISSILSLAA